MCTHRPINIRILLLPNIVITTPKIDLQSGCIRNMALQCSGLNGNRPTTSVDIKGSFIGAKNTTILSFQ